MALEADGGATLVKIAAVTIAGDCYAPASTVTRATTCTITQPKGSPGRRVDGCATALRGKRRRAEAATPAKKLADGSRLDEIAVSHEGA